MMGNINEKDLLAGKSSREEFLRWWNLQISVQASKRISKSRGVIIRREEGGRRGKCKF